MATGFALRDTKGDLVKNNDGSNKAVSDGNKFYYTGNKKKIGANNYYEIMLPNSGFLYYTDVHLVGGWIPIDVYVEGGKIKKVPAGTSDFRSLFETGGDSKPVGEFSAEAPKTLDTTNGIADWQVTGLSVAGGVTIGLLALRYMKIKTWQAALAAGLVAIATYHVSNTIINKK